MNLILINIKRFGTYPLLESWNEFEGTLIEGPLDGSVTRDA
jgi:hypothetical protein